MPLTEYLDDLKMIGNARGQRSYTCRVQEKPQRIGSSSSRQGSYAGYTRGKEREIERKRAEIQKEVASQKVDEQIEKPLTPPEVIKPVETEIKPQEEKIFAVQFKAYGTRQQLKQLKEFMKKEGIRYE